MNVPDMKIISATEHLLPTKVEQLLRRARVDKFSGTVQLNMKEGRIHGFRKEEIVMLSAHEIL